MLHRTFDIVFICLPLVVANSISLAFRASTKSPLISLLLLSPKSQPIFRGPLGPRRCRARSFEVVAQSYLSR